ncbi:acyltransferase [Aeromonas veronii]|uniref:acyltransferase n=1 Tax=Aeromonas veronii TaxID=654 RepID=UPI003D2207EC
MLRIIKRLFFFIYNNYQIRVDPVSYAKRIGVKIHGNVHFYGVNTGTFGSEPWLIEIGDNVHITGGVQFINHDGGVLILRGKVPTLEITKPIKIGNNVYIGMNSMILPGVTVEDNVIIAAGSVVTKSLKMNAVYGGIPARKIKDLDAYMDKCVKESLGFGNLKGIDKEKKLKEYYCLQNERKID